MYPFIIRVVEVGETIGLFEDSSIPLLMSESLAEVPVPAPGFSLKEQPNPITQAPAVAVVTATLNGLVPAPSL